ncbi:hypothetical protein E3D00_06620 [Swingsia samuiensis]|uniref:DUF4412 domain-containing protein n=1 Tax=Swingsia samuiensis TaxID=1293412 RepID=A0A4Y6UNU1_9PROT|nr:hypothetical protein E3D00_06620 [Swingsia samuiensis]
MKKVFGLALISGVAFSGALKAQTPTAPMVTPMVDVDITYMVVGPQGQHLHQRMRWNANLWRQRVDPEGLPSIMITDYRAHKLMVLDTQAHTAVVSVAPGDGLTAPGVPASGSWKQVGPATIVGQPCMIWESVDTDKQPTDFCYTTDGLLLGATQGGRLVVQASSVNRVAQSPDLFDPPLGYHRIDPAK